MWTCKKCNEEIEDVFDACWKCSSDEVIPPKKTNWSVNKKRYRNTIIYISLFCSLVLLLYMEYSSSFYSKDIKKIVLTESFSYSISYFLLYLTYYKSNKLEFEPIVAIAVTIITNVILILFL